MNDPLKFFNLIEGQRNQIVYLILVAKISRTLYELDPIPTGCVENLVTDEYGYEAVEIANMLMCGFALKFSVSIVFDSFFWDDCLDDETLNTICQSLTHNLSSP